jgi:2-methylcitrate dehydratase PrpD
VTSTGGPTAALARFAADLDFAGLPEGVRERAKLCVLDWLGAALAGVPERVSRAAVRTTLEAGGAEQAALIGGAARVPAGAAAWANGVTGHAAELDDIHAEAIIHPGAAVVPAALAAAELRAASGADLLAAVVAGYETAVRAGAAVNPSHYRFWHTTGTCGTFGAAAAAGRLLGLDAAGMARALSIAGTHAAGMLAVFGTDAKALNPGRAARDGLTAAGLAAEGVSAPEEIFEGERGFLRAAGTDSDSARLTAALGDAFAIEATITKRHASCGHTHAALDALLELASEHGIAAADVSAIEVETYAIAAEVTGGNMRPRTPGEARFSMAHCAAAALLRGRVGLEECSATALEDREIADLSARVTVRAHADFDGVRLGAARVRVRTAAGGEFTRRVDAPRGYPDNPMTRDELEEKFAALAALSIPANRAAEIAALTAGLDGAASVEELAGLLAMPTNGG